MIVISTGLDPKLGGPPAVITGSTNSLRKIYPVKILNFGDDLSDFVDLRISKLASSNYGLTRWHIPKTIKHEIRSPAHAIFHGFFLLNLFQILGIRKGKNLWIVPHGVLQKRDMKKNHILKKMFIMTFKVLSKRVKVNFIVSSKTEEQDLRYFISKATVHCLPFGVEAPSIQKSRNEKLANKFNLLCISRITEMKRIELAIEALSLLPDKFKLTVAGEGSENYLKRLHDLCQEKNLANRVEFIGFIEGNAKELIFLDSGILIMVSDYENFGVAIAEAIRRGIPVVVSKNAGISEFVKLNNVGIVIDAQEVSSIAKAIEEVAAEYQYYQTNCDAKSSRLDWDEAIEKWSELFYEQY